MEPLLSILIATYKRKDLLAYNLNNILNQIKAMNIKKRQCVRVNVSVNPSGDGTEEFLKSLCDVGGFSYKINAVNIGAENNMLNLIKHAEGRFIWLVSDDDELAPGLIEKVVDVLMSHTNLGWIFINSVALTNENKIYSYDDIRINGYYADGKTALNYLWKHFPGNVLFQTSNIYLRDTSVRDLDKLPLDNACRWPFNIFNSISNKSAYVFESPLILQGPGRSWSNRFYLIECFQFQQMIVRIGDLPNYNKRFSHHLLRYYLTHEGLVYWIYLFKWLFVDNKRAKHALKFYFKEIPFFTILLILFIPFEIIILLVRHYFFRKIRREKQHKKVLNNSILPQCWTKYL